MSKTTYLKDKESAIRKLVDWESIFTPKIDVTKTSYLATFPYPYVNGQPHLGHISTLSRLEFDSQYQRCKGKNVLVPFAYHATGMPIVAAANKVKYELEQLKLDKSIQDESIQDVESNVESNVENTELTTYRSAKSKLAAKQGVSQIATLISMGVAEEDIPNFTEPWYWVTYFIPTYENVLKQLGYGIDFTCQFTTTSRNPYYDKFVDWQFDQLNKQGKLKYGKRYSIYSPKDKQPCQDHDRSSGEGVQCQEYTLIQFMLTSKNPKSKQIKLIVATMRPETMFGVTNIWIHPDLEYGVYDHEYKDIKDTVIMLPRAANNLQYQEHKLDLIKMMKGSELVGLEVTQFQIGVERKLYVLPMYQISENKGTGIVSSVPSESPDDYLNLYVLTKEGHPHRNKMLETFPDLVGLDINPEPIPIIETTYNDKITNQIAVDFCIFNNIKTPSALAGNKLQEAKRTIYNQSRKGVYILSQPTFNKKPVETLANKMIEIKVKNCVWYAYAEPESEIISRTGDICVASLENQWYIDYGEPSWKKEVKEHMDQMEFYSEKGRNQFEHALDWLGQWPFSRTMGLGSKLKIPCPNPDDKNEYLIDSLSDSTLYMVLYPIYPILKTFPIDKLDNSVFDYIFRYVPLSASHTFTNNELTKLHKMEVAFHYWYPMDIRVSGKDLIQNHFIMCLYNHIAILPKKCWPRSFKSNGHITINKEKMSKSKGNFITAKDITDVYGADTVRLAMAHGTSDPIDDTNYEAKKAIDGTNMPSIDIVNASFSKLYEMYNWVDEVFEKFSSYRKEEMNFFDQVILEQIRVITIETIENMEKQVHYEAIVRSFNQMLTNRNSYLSYTSNDPHQKVIQTYLEYFSRLNVPFIPHLCEYIHQNLHKALGMPAPQSIRIESYPTPKESTSPEILKKYLYIDNTITAINKALKVVETRDKKTIADIKKIIIGISDVMPEWKVYVASLIDNMLIYNTPEVVLKTNAPILNKDEKLKSYELNFKKNVQPFVSIYIKFNDMFKFDKTELLKSVQSNLANMYNTEIEIVFKEDADPMKPFITFE